MRVLINAVLLLAFAAPVAAVAQDANEGPTCSGSLDGSLLTTVIRFPDGYTVEGAWQILENRTASLRDGRQGRQMSMMLDGIIEINPETGERKRMPLPQPIETEFEGENEEELVYRAARVWCTAILKAREDAPRRRSAPTQLRS
jgi:hypothetical protein